MKKVLVTGGMGFIGFHLCQRLLEEGVEVIVIDEMPAERAQEQEEMQMRLGRNAQFHLVQEKIENVELSSLLKGIDTVFHLAAQTKFDSKWPRLAGVIEKNVNITAKLVDACTTGTKFIYASTIEVYGRRPGKISERTPTNPTSPYGITKLASELMIKKKAAEKGLPYIILRLPTVYGPWQRSDMTYQKLLLGNNPEFVASDRSTLDLLYVKDVVEGFLLAATSHVANEVIQLTSGHSNLWFEGVKIAAGKDGWYVPSKVETTLSSEKADSILGFKAQTRVEDGLAKQRQHVTQWLKQQGL